MRMNELLLESYDYKLPKELIALSPIMPQENAKLLVYDRKDCSIAHTTFRDFASFLPKKTLLVFNDTKVIPARIYGKKPQKEALGGGKIEALFHKEIMENLYLMQLKGRLKIGNIVEFGEVFAKILKDCGMGFKEVSFFKDEKCLHPLSHQEFFDFLQQFGHIPLPPYIKREDNQEDRVNYNSVFAKNMGAIAAPTASLHFSQESFRALQMDFESAFVTLHVGAGTFIGVSTENILEHKMHQETFVIPKESVEKIKKASHITAIGTTAARVLEYFARTKEMQGECDLFLHPQNKPIITNALLTNFHLPKTTLLMLVASFVGLDETKRIYQQAIEKKYRFYSYGDGMLVL